MILSSSDGQYRGPDPLDLSVEQRRLADVCAHEIVDAVLGVQHMAIDLRRDRSRPSRTRRARGDCRPFRMSKREKSMLLRSRRGGVPVFNGPTGSRTT